MMAPDRLRAFLHDVQRAALTRAGYARVYLQWLGQPATKAQKADAEAALRLGLIAWPSMVPGTAATLTDSGRVSLRSVPLLPSDLEAWAAKWGAPMDAQADLRRLLERGHP